MAPETHDKLIREAQRVGRHATKKAAVTAALQEYVQRRKSRRITALFGQVEYWPDYDHRRTRARSHSACRPQDPAG